MDMIMTRVQVNSSTKIRLVGKLAIESREPLKPQQTIETARIKYGLVTSLM